MKGLTLNQREQEDAQGYFLLSREIIESKGIPLALYSDRHSIFQVNPKQRESLEEQLAGERQPTQVGRALKELGIQSILALSPQAKGRIERLWGTFQDRLVGELRLAMAATLEEANQVLWQFLPRFNTRFAVPAAQSGSAYRSPEHGTCLEGVLCFKYQRTVAKDNTVNLGQHTLQLLPGPGRSSYARARVEVQERLDGSMAVVYQGKVVASREAPPHPAKLRARKNSRPGAKEPNMGLTLEVSPDAVGTQGNGVVELGLKCEDTRPQAGKARLFKPSPDHPWRKPLLVTKSLNR
jgi:hypothetical protein